LTITQRILDIITGRFLPASIDKMDTLTYWRELIVFTILASGLLVAPFVMVPSFSLTIKHQAWGMTILNATLYFSGIILLFVRPPNYALRTGYVLASNYAIGLGVLLSFGPMSGGPSWLFCFSILSAVLLGLKGAIAALIINVLTMTVYGWFFGPGPGTPTFPFFTEPIRGMTAAANFFLVNTMAAIAVAVLVRGLVAAHHKEKRLTLDLKKEQARLSRMAEDLQSEVRERLHAEEDLKHTLFEKDILLREIHHRVKNNLQIVNSLLSLQMNRINHPDVIEHYQATMSRVRAMAFVHETLYHSNTLSKIDFQHYLSGLVKQCSSLFDSSNRNIEVTIKAQDIVLMIEQATPCGLIVNELVMNALKYAFPDNRSGKIDIIAGEGENNDIELTVTDNGIGLVDGFDWRKADSMGLNLVRLLAEGQLQGTILFDNTNGVTFRIRFNRG
jgi:two-component sensor histidine kinase